VALRDVAPRLEDAHSLQVVVVLLLHGQAVLSAQASKDVRLGLVDILCRQHQLYVVSYPACKQISPVDISQNSYGCTRTSRHLLSHANSWVVYHSLQVCGPQSKLILEVVLQVVLRVVLRVVLEVVLRVVLEVVAC